MSHFWSQVISATVNVLSCLGCYLLGHRASRKDHKDEYDMVVSEFSRLAARVTELERIKDHILDELGK